MKTTNAAATLASVVFLKIQEFARRPVQEQTRLRAQLEAVVAVTAAELAPAGRIVLDAADGAAIVALSATAAGLPLCIGVNHGAVQVASGGRGAEGMTGDGISVAASVAEFASPTRLLLSRSFREALADAAPGLDSGLFAAGVFTDAGLRTHELFSPDRHAAARRRKRLIALGATAVILIVGAGVAVRVSLGGHPKFLDGMIAKLGISVKDGGTYIRSLREKLKL